MSGILSAVYAVFQLSHLIDLFLPDRIDKAEDKEYQNIQNCRDENGFGIHRFEGVVGDVLSIENIVAVAYAQQCEVHEDCGGRDKFLLLQHY